MCIRKKVTSFMTLITQLIMLIIFIGQINGQSKLKHVLKPNGRIKIMIWGFEERNFAHFVP